MDKRKEIMKYRFADPQKAYHICCELLKQGQQSGNDFEIAYAYLYMGDTLFSMGKCKKALSCMTLAQQVQQQNGFDQLLMKTYNIMGIIYINEGDALLALDYYHAALRLAKKYHNYTLAAMIYSNIGSLLSDVGDPAESVKYYKLSYECSRKKGEDDSEVSFNDILLYMNICEGYLNEKQYDKAKEFLDDALLSINKDDISVPERMRIAHKYAVIYYHLKDYDKAYEMCMEAVMFCGVNRKDLEIFDDYMDLAEIMADTGHLEQAGQLLDAMEEIAQQTNIDNQKLKICNIRILIYEKTKEMDQLNEQLQNYYRIKKRRNAERNGIIISAINNRCRLEEERKKNRFLNADNRKLIRESERDELTEIYNRLAFKRRYDKLYKYAFRNHYTYCVGIFDIDNFKGYNDSYGHLQGDACLKRVAQILRETSDGNFCVARYGGDEFVFMAYGVGEENVRDFCQKLVENIRQEHIPFDAYGKWDYVTISVGVILQDTTEEVELSTLLKKADQVLYEVKQAGKNGYKIQGEFQKED